MPRFTDEQGFRTSAERSKLMGKIRSKETEAEILFRKKLWHAGFRYRINVKKLPGTPDIVINKLKIIIFIDGEFWHGYDWEVKREKIKSNRDFWIPKIERNMQRDRENEVLLKKLGYHVFRFWANDVKKDANLCLSEIMRFSESQSI